MIVRDPALKQILPSVAGDFVKPLTLKIRHYGREDALRVYSNLLLEDLLQKISILTEKEPKSLTVKVVEDTVIRRVDRRVFNQDNPTIKNTLNDLKI
jgi:ssRNA-specific RNase YbeY (16S rRNA maturation enzyme)